MARRLGAGERTRKGFTVLSAIYLAAVVLLGSICFVILRRQARESSESLRAVLESTADGILVVGASGRIVAYNHRFADLLRIPESLRESRDDEAILRYAAAQLRNPDVFLGKVRELCDDPEAKSDDVLEFEDGRIYERHSEPQRLRRRTVGHVWGFRDVTDLHRNRAKLEAPRTLPKAPTARKANSLPI